MTGLFICLFVCFSFQSYHWAIGTSPGSTDIQNFEFVGLNQTNKNSNLEGRLFNNKTYFVTVIARNGAGLETTYEFDGNLYMSFVHLKY